MDIWQIHGRRTRNILATIGGVDELWQQSRRNGIPHVNRRQTDDYRSTSPDRLDFNAIILVRAWQFVYLGRRLNEKRHTHTIRCA